MSRRSPARRTTRERPRTTSPHRPTRDFRTVAPLAADIRGRLAPADD